MEVAVSARVVSELRESRAVFKGVILNIVKHFRTTHQRVAAQVFQQEYSKYQPFQFWLPDNELLRKLGEFDPDVRGNWAMGAEQRFASLLAKYSVAYSLTNPSVGPLSCEEVEGPRYRLDERIAKLTEEFMERCR
jgi:hypothetical protein